MYTKVEEALHFMIKANKGLKIKTENTDRSFHPIGVYMIIRDITSTEDILIAALLHDTINYTDYGYEDIEERFGTLVADIVSDLSEDLSIAKWFERKKDYIRRLRKNNDSNVMDIMIADKIHNLLMLYDNFNKYGDKVWKSTGGTRDENCFLYREVYNIGKLKRANPKLMERYKELIIEFFGDIDEQEENF